MDRLPAGERFLLPGNRLMDFVCPVCRSPLSAQLKLYRCASCGREFPLVAGIADFRLWPDPYIGLSEDRE